MAQVDPPTDEEEEENIVITSLIWRRPIRVFWEKGRRRRDQSSGKRSLFTSDAE